MGFAYQQKIMQINKIKLLLQSEKPVSTPKLGLHPQKSLFLVEYIKKKKKVIYYKLMEQGRTTSTDIYCQSSGK